MQEVLKICTVRKLQKTYDVSFSTFSMFSEGASIVCSTSVSGAGFEAQEKNTNEKSKVIKIVNENDVNLNFFTEQPPKYYQLFFHLL